MSTYIGMKRFLWNTLYLTNPNLILGSYAQKNPGAKDDSIKKKLKDAVTDHQQLRSKNGNRRQMAVVFMDKNGLVHLFGSKLLRTVLQESSIKQKIVDSPLWLNKEVMC